jgi:hypothetical protein
MPWTPSDAPHHTAKADTEGRRKLWAKVANRTLAIAKDQGGADADGHAIRVANAAVERSHRV